MQVLGDVRGTIVQAIVDPSENFSTILDHLNLNDIFFCHPRPIHKRTGSSVNLLLHVSIWSMRSPLQSLMRSRTHPEAAISLD